MGFCCEICLFIKVPTPLCAALGPVLVCDSTIRPKYGPSVHCSDHRGAESQGTVTWLADWFLIGINGSSVHIPQSSSVEARAGQLSSRTQWSSRTQRSQATFNSQLEVSASSAVDFMDKQAILCPVKGQTQARSRIRWSVPSLIWPHLSAKHLIHLLRPLQTIALWTRILIWSLPGHWHYHLGPLIQGYPWLRRHSPHVDWASAATHTSRPAIRSTLINLWEVFSKAKATSLWPHCPHDIHQSALPVDFCSRPSPTSFQIEIHLSTRLPDTQSGLSFHGSSGCFECRGGQCPLLLVFPCPVATLSSCLW